MNIYNQTRLALLELNKVINDGSDIYRYIYYNPHHGKYFTITQLQWEVRRKSKYGKHFVAQMLYTIHRTTKDLPRDCKIVRALKTLINTIYEDSLSDNNDVSSSIDVKFETFSLLCFGAVSTLFAVNFTSINNELPKNICVGNKIVCVCEVNNDVRRCKVVRGVFHTNKFSGKHCIEVEHKDNFAKLKISTAIWDEKKHVWQLANNS